MKKRVIEKLQLRVHQLQQSNDFSQSEKKSIFILTAKEKKNFSFIFFVFVLLFNCFMQIK